MRKIIMTLSVVFAFVLSAAAQDRVISGRVTNDKEAPIEGVSVTSSDGKGGTQTDKNGNYSLTVSATTKSLLFSYVNFETATRTIGRATSISVTLISSDVRMEEVVVVGYGVQQRRAFTGSTSKVDTKEFAQLITPSIDKQLAGRAAGVNVNNAGGSVNTPARIRIRGTNSLTQGRSPLIIVDGTPITTGNLALATNSNALGDINPNDIETIDVLKDGASTAIYGSAAANGVIQITTKKGSKGRLNVNYDATIGYSSPQQRFDVLNAAEFVSVANQKFINAGQLPQARLDPLGVNTNWQNNVLVNNAFSTSHTLSFSGGTDKSTFYTSINYADSRGIVRTNRNKAYRLRSNAETQVNKWLKLSNNLAVSRQLDNDQNNGSNALSGSIVGAIRALPNVEIYNKNTATGYNITGNSLGQGSNFRTIDDNYTNIAFVLDKNRFESDKYRVLDNIFLELSLVKGLKFHSQLGVDYFSDNSLQINDPRHGDGFSSNGIIFQGDQTILSTQIQNYLNYTFSLKGHNFFLTAGHELSQSTTRVFTGQGVNIADLFYLKENIITNTAVTPSISGTYDKTANESYFGRINYDYKGRFFAQASMRTDGQSSLAAGKKYGNFPGFSIGWRPLQENFWKQNAFLNNNISDLKLKASYARVGNPVTGYRYLSTYGTRPYGNLPGIAASRIGRPELQWERSIKYDYGIEIGFLKNRLNLTVDYFKNNVDKLIQDVPVPFSMGIPLNLISQNIGKIHNRGVELSVNATPVHSKEFEWNINFNYSHIVNKIDELYSVAGVDVKSIVGRTNYNIDSIGESIASIYGYRFAGVNTANGNPVYYNAQNRLVQRNVSNGTYYFATSLSDPTLGAITTLSQADKAILGSAQPTYYGGFTNSFNYKNFGLEVFFRFQGGNKIVNITRQEILLNQKFANGGRELLNSWNTPGQVTNVPKLWYGNDAIVNQNGEAISRFVEDGKFLRLQNIVFTYAVNNTQLQNRTNNHIKSLRFFVQAQNVAVWTKYRGIDPEAFSEDGQDNSISPPVRNISVGFNLGL
ncbi:MAG: SusC/RagA family TonB-linked outer membrane protein [Ferruginibacter sp.]